ncbi:hypothetical protein IWQ62_003727 [Dispira parvispora]|uniref:Uncharacterized protein n=1 Tax=Dispira parvispora TaxID=1520584 RepID=A0A9W8E2N1_9FUNG|nr:hypothetical protein IWQ62_003727 [Dispira parvispora]
MLNSHLRDSMSLYLALCLWTIICSVAVMSVPTGQEGSSQDSQRPGRSDSRYHPYSSVSRQYHPERDPYSRGLEPTEGVSHIGPLGQPHNSSPAQIPNDPQTTSSQHSGGISSVSAPRSDPARDHTSSEAPLSTHNEHQTSALSLPFSQYETNVIIDLPHYDDELKDYKAPTGESVIVEREVVLGSIVIQAKFSVPLQHTQAAGHSLLDSNTHNLLTMQFKVESIFHIVNGGWVGTATQQVFFPSLTELPLTESARWLEQWINISRQALSKKYENSIKLQLLGNASTRTDLVHSLPVVPPAYTHGHETKSVDSSSSRVVQARNNRDQTTLPRITPSDLEEIPRLSPQDQDLRMQFLQKKLQFILGLQEKCNGINSRTGPDMPTSSGTHHRGSVIDVKKLIDIAGTETFHEYIKKKINSAKRRLTNIDDAIYSKSRVVLTYLTHETNPVTRVYDFSQLNSDNCWNTLQNFAHAFPIMAATAANQESTADIIRRANAKLPESDKIQRFQQMYKNFLNDMHITL